MSSAMDATPSLSASFSVDSTCARLRSHLESSPSSAFVCHCPACAHSTSAHLLSPLPSTSARSRENPTTMLTSDITNTYLKCNPQFSYTQASNPKRVLTKPSKPVLNDGHDNADSDYILYVNDVLGSQEGQQFQILDLLGQGTFGQVVKCVNIKTKETVAVKVIKNKPAYYNQSLVEVAILDILNNKWDHSDKYHIVFMKDTFVFRNHLCIVFEMLSVNLYELIKQNNFRGLSIKLVKLFVQQILECLVLLSKAKIIHSDLKPENILLKSLDSPTIKVIDFGSACHENQTIYTYIQSRFYRSPEVLVGLPYTSSIDMWSLGCIAAELFLGLPLFPGTSEYNQVSRIVGVMGMPQHWMCEKGKNARNYFTRGSDGTWGLKSVESYMRETGNSEQPPKRYYHGDTLEEIINSYPLPRRDITAADREEEMLSRQCLIDFLGGLLKLNPLERWSPQQAKMHPFVTGERYTGPFALSATFRMQPSAYTPPSNVSNAPSSTEGSTSHVQAMDLASDTPTNQQQHQQQHQQQSQQAVASRRPRANTMIQAVPPQLQKIVTIQQQSGPNKVSLRNAAASGGSSHAGSITSSASGAKPFSASSLNNDEVIYVSAEKGKEMASSGSGGGATPMEADEWARSRAGSSTIMGPGVSYDPKYLTNHYPLRKAVSETLYTAHHQQQYLNSPNGPPQLPLQSITHLPAESLGHFPPVIGQPGSGAYYEGSHVPYEILASMNYGYNVAVDPALSNQQQHPRMGEKGERKGGFASRAPSLPGLAEWDPFGNSLSAAVSGSEAPPTTSFVQYRRSSSNQMEYSPGIEPNGGGPSPMRNVYDGSLGNASPRFQNRNVTSAQGYTFPNGNAYASSPRNAFPASPRAPHQPQQSGPYSPSYQYQQPQQPQQQQLLQYSNGVEGSTAPHGYNRGRSVSLSMHGQFPLNQPWNQPIQHQVTPPQYQQNVSRSGSGAGGSGDLKKRRAPPNISTALASSPQHFQQIYHQQPFSAQGTSNYPPYSTGPQSASATDVSQIHPQRLNHPANIGMRRSSVQYGTSPSTFGPSNFHGSVPSGLGMSLRVGSSNSLASLPTASPHSSAIPFGTVVSSVAGGTGLGLDFTKANIPNSPKSASALSGRAMRFSNLPPELADAPLIGETGRGGGTVTANNGDDAVMSDAANKQ